MKPYYTWQAVLEDGNILNQFEGEDETPFSEVDAVKDEIESFRIDGEDDSFVEVFLKKTKKGTVNCNGKKTFSLKDKTLPIELVYSRRNQVRVKIGEGVPLSSRVTHRIGLSNTNENLVLEVFPGLQMAPKNVLKKVYNKSTKKETDTNITADFE